MIVSPSGDDFSIISEGNTTIIHYQLSIIHSCVSTRNGDLLGHASIFGREFLRIVYLSTYFNKIRFSSAIMTEKI